MKQEFEENGFQVSTTSLEAKDTLPQIVPVVPLRDIVIYPYMMYPILAGRESTIKAINTSIEKEKYIMLVAQKDSRVEEPSAEQLYVHGTMARIIQVIKLPNNLIKVLVDGIAQAKVTKFTQKDYIEAEIKYIFPSIKEGVELDALIRHSNRLFEDYVKSQRGIAQETIFAYENISEPDRKLYYIASTILVSIEKKQKLLELNDLAKQYFELNNILTSELEILKVEKDIENKISQSLQRNQRKFIVQEQIRILQDELNDDEETDPEFIKLKEAITKSKMPKEVKAKAQDEFTKLKKTPPMSPEATVTRNYLDWITSMPWGKYTKDNLDINHAKKILDEDHFGLEKPKERILEYIAVLNKLKNLNKHKKEKAAESEHHRALIICFVGPPGVGKTSIARSIARALNRNFVRISLGGVRDEAEIRGHRRTYIGSMPGKIIQSIRKAASTNPIILMDEIDKMGMDWRGDPASALLEALDPEQNYAFNDHYLDIDYDLSKVLFITTANVQYNIPLPLQDRMEIIEMHGYLEFEKLEIARIHILPKLMKETGLNDKEVKLEDSAIKSIINLYTREAGVRNLERELASLLRKIAKEVVYAKLKDKKKKDMLLVVNSGNIDKYLGIPRFREKLADKEDKVGSVVGLAWTSHGGDILNIEVSVMDGREKITLTGQLGEVMKESALAGLSYIRSNSKKFGINPNFFKNKEIHVHIPEGSIPKDGPSAGLTMAVAILSAVTNRAVYSGVAMTGEITLRGQILQIGGLNEKLLAAQRSGIKTVLIPKGNEKDLKEIPEKIMSGLKIKLVENFEDALIYCFAKKFNKLR